MIFSEIFKNFRFGKFGKILNSQPCSQVLSRYSQWLQFLPPKTTAQMAIAKKTLNFEGVFSGYSQSLQILPTSLIAQLISVSEICRFFAFSDFQVRNTMARRSEGTPDVRLGSNYDCSTPFAFLDMMFSFCVSFQIIFFHVLIFK